MYTVTLCRLRNQTKIVACCSQTAEYGHDVFGLLCSVGGKGAQKPIPADKIAPWRGSSRSPSDPCTPPYLALV